MQNQIPNLRKFCKRLRSGRMGRALAQIWLLVQAISLRFCAPQNSVLYPGSCYKLTLMPLNGAVTARRAEPRFTPISESHYKLQLDKSNYIL